MNPILRFLMKLYPSPWRARYGEEFHALLEDSGVNWSVAFNVLASALKMRLATASFWTIAASLSLIGAAIALGWSYRTPVRWVSRSEFAVARGQTIDHPMTVRPDGPNRLIVSWLKPQVQLHLASNGERVIFEIPALDRGAAEQSAYLWAETPLLFYPQDPSGSHVILRPLTSRAVRVGPNRFLFSAAGLASGLLLATLFLALRRYSFSTNFM
jgi:hypothetical protein